MRSSVPESLGSVLSGGIVGSSIWRCCDGIPPCGRAIRVAVFPLAGEPQRSGRLADSYTCVSLFAMHCLVSLRMLGGLGLSWIFSLQCALLLGVCALALSNIRLVSRQQTHVVCRLFCTMSIDSSILKIGYNSCPFGALHPRSMGARHWVLRPPG